MLDTRDEMDWWESYERENENLGTTYPSHQSFSMRGINRLPQDNHPQKGMQSTLPTDEILQKMLEEYIR